MAKRAALRVRQENIEDRIAAICTNLDTVDFSTRRHVLDALIPRLPGFGITLHEDGRIEITGALDLSGASRGWGGGGAAGGGSEPVATAGGGSSGASPRFGKADCGTGRLGSAIPA